MPGGRRDRGREVRPGGPIDEGTAATLGVLRRLGRELDGRLDEGSAGGVAEAVTTLLGAEGVAVTDLDRVLHRSGALPGDDVIVESLESTLERRRWDRPLVSEVDVEGRSRPVVTAIVAVEGVPTGTIQAVLTDTSPTALAAIDDLAAVVGAALRAGELELERSHASVSELRALRAQISPHFIHNSLTAIAGLVRQDPARARTLISRFAEFLRSSFRTDAEFATLADELRLVEIYLDLERARFGDRFEITLRVAPDVLPVRLPYLTVQPLVENAIRHGLEHRTSGGRLSIVAEDALTEARIDVDDNGVGTDPDALSEALQGRRPSPHLGVLAVDERLRSAFGPEYGLIISTGPDLGTKVSMRIPKSGPVSHRP